MNDPSRYWQRQFVYDHLKTGEMRNVSRLFADLAIELDLKLPVSPAKTECMKVLVNAKDLAVRAVRFKQTDLE